MPNAPGASPRRPVSAIHTVHRGTALAQPLMPTPSFAPTEPGRDLAGVTIGTITNAYFSHGPSSRPGSAWNAAQLGSTYSLGISQPVSAALGTAVNPVGQPKQLAAADASLGNAWQPCPEGSNLWQHPGFGLGQGLGAAPYLAGPLASCLAAEPSSPGQDLSVLGSKRGNSLPAEHMAQAGDDYCPAGFAGVHWHSVMSFPTNNVLSHKCVHTTALNRDLLQSSLAVQPLPWAYVRCLVQCLCLKSRAHLCIGPSAHLSAPQACSTGLFSSAASSASSKRHKTAHASPPSVKSSGEASRHQLGQALTAHQPATAALGQEGLAGMNVGAAPTQQSAAKEGSKPRSPAKSPPRYHFHRSAAMLVAHQLQSMGLVHSRCQHPSSVLACASGLLTFIFAFAKQLHASLAHL